MNAAVFKKVAVFLIAVLMAPVSALAECDWGGSSTPEDVFAQACKSAGGCPNGCSCNPCGSTYRPPDPRVAALQRANQRMTDLLQRWKTDFQYTSIDDWQSGDRSSEAAFLSFAERLDRAFIDQLNDFNTDLWRDQTRAASVAAADRAIAAYRHDIVIYDRYLTRYGPTFDRLARLNADIQAFESVADEYRARRDRDRLLAVAALSVYLPKRSVKVTPETLSRYQQQGKARDDGEVFPFGRAPRDIIPPSPAESVPAPDQILSFPVAASPAPYLYSRLPGAPEEAVAVLEADEQRALRAFQARNDYDKAHGEIFDEDRKNAEVARLGKEHGEKRARVVQIVSSDPQNGLFPRLDAAMGKVQTSAATMINRAAESLVWELTKNTVIDLAKKVVADKTHAELTALYLGEDEILDKYEGHLYNVFSLPEVVFKAKDLQAVQNDMLTLLKQDQLYAKTAVRLAATVDPVAVRSFVDGMFAKLDQDGTKLVDDALSASSTMPEPVRTLASRYFTRSFRDKSDAE